MLNPGIIQRSHFSKEDIDILDRFCCKLDYHDKLHSSWAHGGNQFNKEKKKAVEDNWKQLQLEELKAWEVIDKYENVLLINGEPLETTFTKP